MKNKKNLFIACSMLLCALLHTPVFASTSEALQQNQQQRGTIKGRVTDNLGEPIIGATIKLKDQKVGTSTDIDGNYSIVFTERPTAIMVSYIGYSGRMINYIGQSVMDVVLNEDVKMLQEVVVTGYQTISKERATGAFAILGEKTINEKINLDPISAIEGKVAGVTTYGSDIIIRGRSTLTNDKEGLNSNPLIVIDGMPTEQKIQNINMNDVASFTFLKDAASASIYGVRAANGVIVITTKKGAVGKTTVSFVADWKIEQNPSLSDYHYLSTASYMEGELRSINARAISSKRSELDYLNDQLVSIRSATASYYSPFMDLRQRYLSGALSKTDYDNTVAAWGKNDYRQDYIDQMWRNPFRQSYNLSISNASERQNTYISFNYTGNSLQLKPESNETLKAYIKSTQNVNKWLTVNVGIDARYHNEDELLSYFKSGGSNGQFSQIEPYSQIVDENGEKVYREWTNLGSTSSYIPTTSTLKLNPKMVREIEALKGYESLSFNLLDELNNKASKGTMEVRSFAELNFRIYKGLKFKAGFDYEMMKSTTETMTESNSFLMRSMRNTFTSMNPDGTFVKNIPVGARFEQLDASSSNYTFRNQLDYETEIKKDHHITALGGFEMRQIELPFQVQRLMYGYDPVALSSTTMDNLILSTASLAPTSYIYNKKAYSSTEFSNPKLTYTMNRFISMYGAGSYSYKNLYSFSGSIRVDQANLFGTDPKYRYRPLWSLGGTWNMSNEAFMKDISWINRMTLRGSYGITGNVDQKSSPYVLVNINTADRFTDPTQYYQLAGIAPNPLLRWEKTTSYGAGLDFDLFGNLLSGKLDGYYKYSDDLLASQTMSPASGYASAKVNNGAMSNTGFELTLSSPWFKNKDWALTSSIVFAYNKNQIEKVNITPTYAAQRINQNGLPYYEVGKPRYSLYTYHYAGLSTEGNDFQQGAPIVTKKDGTPLYTISEDGNINYISGTTLNPSEAIYQGSLEPIWNGSFTQNIRFKDWELTGMFTFYGGHMIRTPAFDYNSTALSLPDGTISEDFERSWTPTNKNTNVPKGYSEYAASGASKLTYVREYWLYSDANIAKGDMIRLRNVALSYNLSPKLCKSLHLQHVKVTAQGNNLCFWSAAGNGIDPETVTLNSRERAVATQPSFLMRFELSF